MPNKITHIIYDMDGLLLDTEPLYTEVYQKIAQKFGKNFTLDLKSRLIGKKASDSAKIFMQELNIDLTLEQYFNLREPLLEAAFQNTQPMPGAVELSKNLHQKGILQAIGTSSSERLFQIKAKQHVEWFKLFHSVITSDNKNVKNAKPAPDIFLAAAKAMQANPENCLVFEDAPSGIQAALNANMQVVAVPDPNMPREIFKDASQIIKSLHDFDYDYWGL